MLAIISRLDIGESDRRWLEAIRRRFDPQKGMVDGHVTLVFPFDRLGVSTVATHAGAVAAVTAPIAFRLATVQAVCDALGPRSHLFLIPAQGADDICALHDRLYTGPLAPMLRTDIPYQPHVTVGAFSARADAQRAAAGLGAIDIPGRLESIDLVEIAGRRLTDLYRIPLGAKGDKPRTICLT